MEQQRIVFRGGMGEVPHLVPREPLGLLVHAECDVVGDVHVLGGVPPAGRFLQVDAEFAGTVGIPLRRFRGRQQVMPGHQVRVDVVVGEGAVLVRAGDAVDVEPALGIVVAQGAPEPCGLRQQVHPDPAGERLVACRVDVADHRVGDVGVDVEGGGAGRPVTRGLLAVDRPPREGGTLVAELGGPLHGRRKRAVPPLQRAGGRVGSRQREHRQDEGLGIPERVPVVAGPGQAFRRDRAVLAAGAGLQHVEQPEPHRLLDLGVPVDLHVGAVPKVLKVLALLGEQAIPARLLGAAQRRPYLVPDRGQRPGARPPVRDELGQLQSLPRLHHGGRRDHAAVGKRPGLDVHVGPVDQVIHRGADAQLALPGPVHENHGRPLGVLILLLERVLKQGPETGIAAQRRQLLVREKLGLQRDPHGAFQRLHLVPDRGDRPLGERHDPGGRDPDRSSGRRNPFGLAAERTRTEVQAALVGAELAVADVERLIVDEQPDQLAVGDVEDGLPGLRQAVRRLGIGQRPHFIEPVEVGPRQGVGLALVQVRPPAKVAVRKGEDRLRLGHHVQVQLGLPQAPGLHGERLGLDHDWSSSSARSATTTSAPCFFRASACPVRSTPTTKRNLPARPASTPASASSKTAASCGPSPSARAAARKVSGAGFPRRCSRPATTPSIRASNRSSMPTATRMSRQLALDDTTAERRPASRTAWT